MIRALGEKKPSIAPSAFVSEAAYVVGDVVIGEQSSIWPGTVVRGDGNPIRIGAGTNIQDNSTVHGGEPVDIGDQVSIGHNVVVHCRRIGNGTLIGNAAILLDGAVIGNECLVAAGTVVVPGLQVPDRSMVIGSPPQVKPLEERHLQRLSYTAASYHRLSAEHRAAGLGSDPA